MDVTRCYKCWGYNHLAKNCKKETTCRLCAENYDEKNCQSKKLNCVNCIRYVKKFNLENWMCDHEVTSKNCEYHKKIIVKQKQHVHQMSEKQKKNVNPTYPFIIALNICGFVRNKDILQNFISLKRPDILCLSETHVSDDIEDHEIQINNYNIMRTNTENNRTGGTITYIKSNIKRKSLLNDADIIKGTWINIFEVCGSERVKIINVYRSPQSNISHFCKNFNNLVEDMLDSCKVIIVGDFNIDIRKKDYYYDKKILNDMAQLGLKQKINEPTRSTFKSDTIIDLVFTNFKLNTKVLKSPKISDHNIIEIYTSHAMSDIIKPVENYQRNYSKFDKEIFKK